MAERESKQILLRARRGYRGLQRDAVLARLLGAKRARMIRPLTVVYFGWQQGARTPAGDRAGLTRWLTERLGKVSEAEVDAMLRAYGNPRLNLLDYAYLLGRHPLEVYCAAAHFDSPSIGWDELWNGARGARDASSRWLLNTRRRGAQDLRLRIRFEEDAFRRMTPYWQRLGFAFGSLTPSLATAIGNSADRPSALAEILGIVLNDGLRLPRIELERLGFAEGTPYHTVLEPGPPVSERVLPVEVARTIRAVLAEVVSMGTARRVDGAFKLDDGTRLAIGGKTGSGDNRFETFGRGGRVLSAEVVNRTAVFAFYFGDRFFGVILAYVPGEAAAHYGFTSSLPVAILRMLAPDLVARHRLDPTATRSHAPAAAH
jgi:hypothetical protein